MQHCMLYSVVGLSASPVGQPVVLDLVMSFGFRGSATKSEDRRCDVGLASCGAPCLFPTELGEIFSPTRCDVASFWWWWWGGVRVIG